MARIEGRPLDKWLHGVDENSAKRLPPAELVDGPLPGGRHASRGLADAAAVAAALMEQLAPVFAALAGIAFHRDVSAHNLLVHGEEGAEEFALLDFGLAVRSATWESDYKTRNISGDPRYFTPAAWMLLVHGLKYLRGHPDSSFLNQYRCRLDHFSFGMVVLEVFFALWKGPELDDLQDLGAAKVQSLRDAWSAWRAFWTNAIRFFQLFHAEGAAATREKLARTQGLFSYVDNLRTLCSALRSAADSVPQAVTSAVFRIAADLVDPRGSSTWAQLPGFLAAASSCAGETDKGAVKGGVSEATCSSARGAQHLQHRRNWSLDAAASLTRNTPDLVASPGLPCEATASLGHSRLGLLRKC